MELPTQFKQFDYIIEVIHKLICPEYLLTKNECLRWYCRNFLNPSPYTINIVSYPNGYIDKYLGKGYDYYIKDKLSYDITQCTCNGKELTTDDIFKLLSNVNEEKIKVVLSNYVNPTYQFGSELIEKELGKKIFPLDRNLLLHHASYKFVCRFIHLFTQDFIKNNEEKYITVKNNENNHVIKIPKNSFKLYCGINESIGKLDGNDGIIVVPFEFKYRAKIFLQECLKQGKFVDEDNFNITRIDEHDFAEFQQLIAYLQISF